jgi:hypothetical protein
MNFKNLKLIFFKNYLIYSTLNNSTLILMKKLFKILKLMIKN